MNHHRWVLILVLLGSKPTLAQDRVGSVGEPAVPVPQARLVPEQGDSSLSASFTISRNANPIQFMDASHSSLAFEALETHYGLNLAGADETLRTQLELPAGQGVVVVGVKAGSLAEQAGLKSNDVLLSLGDAPATETHQVGEILLKLGKDPLEVKLIRAGKHRRMSLVGPNHGFPPQTAGYWIGVPVSPVDPTLRTHLTALPADSGLIVNDVVKDSPADAVGVKKDDVLVAMNGKPLATSDALIAQIQAAEGKPVPLQFLRGGKLLNLTITPAKRAHPTVIQLKKYEGPQLGYQVVHPDLAIELPPRREAAYPGSEKWSWNSASQARGVYQLLAPYSAQIVDPYAGLPTLTQNSLTYTPKILPTYPSTPIPGIDRIEGQLAEIKSKLDELARSLEGLKAPSAK